MRPIEVSQRRRFEPTKAAPAPSTSSNRIPSEFLRELQSAASMIMSREECEAVAQEFAQLRRSNVVAA